MMLMIESAPEGRAGYIGRSSISITLDIYAHVTPHMQQLAASAMDDLFGGDELLEN